MTAFLKKHNWTVREAFLVLALVVVIAVACAPAARAALSPDPIHIQILNEGSTSYYGNWVWHKLSFVDQETGHIYNKKCLVWMYPGFRMGGVAFCEEGVKNAQ